MKRRAMRNRLQQHPIALSVAALFLMACVKSELDVPPDHPGNPSANSAKLAPSTALRKESAPREDGEPPGLPHAGHEHHSATPAPTAGEASQPSSAPSQQTPDGTTYVCPMHPEVVRKEPGECPICGMKLVPKKATK